MLAPSADSSKTIVAAADRPAGSVEQDHVPPKMRRSGRRDLGQLLLILCFGLCILIPGTLQLAGVQTATHESRTLASAPGWPKRVTDLITLPQRTEAFLNDRFGLRGQLVRWNSFLRFSLGVSSSPSVAMGRKNFLFYAYRPERLMEQHTGEDVFSPEELEHWVTAVEANRAWLAERGIAYYIVVAPDKSTIYPEYLPDYPPLPNGTTRLDQLIARLRRNPGLELVDPREALWRAKEEHRLYSRADSHWGPRGAFIAYSMLMDRVRQRFPGVKPVSLADYDIAVKPERGDLAFLLNLYDDLLYPEDSLTWRGPSHQIEKEQLAPQAPWGWPVTHIHTDRQDQPRILTQGDSFTNYVMGPLFLYESFRDPVYTHHNGTLLNYKLIEETHPDLVVLELAERYLRLP